MTTRLDYQKQLRAIENDIIWNQNVALASRDGTQKARCRERLEKLEVERSRLSQIIREWAA